MGPFLGADQLDPTTVRLRMKKAFSFMSGKIRIFWSSPFSVEVIQDTGQVIHRRVSGFFFPEPVLISYVYVSCSTFGWEASRDALTEFANTYSNPWMVGGDFNVVHSLFEISGGRTQPQAAMDALNLALLDCGLEDVRFARSLFTWTNGHTWRRLDKVLCNSLWSGLFSVFRVSHLNRTASDHFFFFFVTVLRHEHC